MFARFSFGGGSALAAANHFPFNVTFEGGAQSLPLALPAALHPMLTLLHTTGGTLSFASAPVVAGVATAAVAYVHSTRAECARAGVHNVRFVLSSGIRTTSSPLDSWSRSPSYLTTQTSLSALFNSG